MTISTSVWHAQHPNAGQNIQQPLAKSNKTRNLVIPFFVWLSHLLSKMVLTFRKNLTNWPRFQNLGDGAY